MFVRNRATTARRVGAFALAASSFLFAPTPAEAARSLRHELGRNEVRIFAAPFRIRPNDLLSGSSLPDRLLAQGYERVRRKPEKPGEFFWGLDRFWIYRRSYSVPGEAERDARLFDVQVDRDSGRVSGIRVDGDSSGGPRDMRLEPVLLAENLAGLRARRAWVAFEDFPESLWRAVLAIEDARFFDHGGVDPRSVARAVLKNAKAGKVTQGGSTITQQLVKIRDLTPRRTMGRKLSEAFRAVALEAEYGKKEILEAYLNSVYMGHVGGVSIYGMSPAARAYFSKPLGRLTLGEAALLAGMIQGPNRLHPTRHRNRALARQRAVLDRLAELGWLPAAEVARARRAGMPPLAISTPPPSILPGTLTWIRDELEQVARKRSKEDRSVVVQTTLDAHLQRLATETVTFGLRRLERRFPRLRPRDLTASLVVLDGLSGDVLATVGGDPRDRDDFDRTRKARRQPGSTVKPLVLLEAFEDCGPQAPAYPSRRVSDRAVTIALPSGSWTPENNDDRFRGTVDLRTVLVKSLNVPTVRLARWCGWDATANRFRSLGLEVPEPVPPSFVLGSVETSPLRLAAAFTTFTTLGRRLTPRIVRRATAVSGRGLGRVRTSSKRVARASTAYLVRDLLRDAGARSIGAASFDRREVIGKTGTSSERRDAWFAGTVGSMVVVAWVGVDGGESLGLSGAEAAAPIWRAFAEKAAGARPPLDLARPRSIVERWVDPKTGLKTRSPRRGAYRELFRDGDEPRKRGFLFRQPPERPIS